MLAVVVIIGVVLTFAVLGIGGDRRGDELASESQQFGELLRLASEQAVLRGEEWAVQIDPEEYRFLIFIEDKWELQQDDELFRARALAKDTELDLQLEGRDVVLETSEELKPTLMLLSSGEISPFSAEFAADDTELRYQVKTDTKGLIQWEGLE
ncbi:MAG: GspH/FimT family protein [Gammaproteobacteria bacterium]|nr:GspH/FimT family protein [Gammaproteobacteria bacterium]